MTDPDKVYTSAVSVERSVILTCSVWAKCRSKDPNTKVGAAVYHRDTGDMFLGYNGFNAGVPDYRDVWDNRAFGKRGKYSWVRHAERNAIQKAWRSHADLSKCFLAVTHYPCSVCMMDWIIPSGIREVFYTNDYPVDSLTAPFAAEANVRLIKLEVGDLCLPE